MLAFLQFCLLLPILTGARPSSGTAGPSIALSYGTFVGLSEGGLDKFLGVPFAQAGRFELPKTPSVFSQPQKATTFGPACPQQSFPTISLPGFSGPVIQPNTLITSEDCLFINVIKPSNLSSDTSLPVLFWIFGGGFEDGDTSANDGSAIVARSIALGEPIIYVSANYRLNAFGFAASQEIKAAGIGNLGLRDQRFALQWVQNNIHIFGGDKTKVTIWGESAGAISVALHMVINGGNQEGLFRGGFMESGSPIPLGDISFGQPFYDQLVVNTGCSDSADSLACLKTVPFETFQNAVNESPNLFSFMSLREAWGPRIDGDLITENPQDSLVKGAFSNIPLANGDCDDEGTLFTLIQSNITTPEEGTNYLHSNYFPSASDSQFEPVSLLYPSDPVVGSPFGTGLENQLTPQFKRLASFQGDFVFQAPRRFFLQIASKRQNVWSFLFKRGKTTQFLGSFHGSDLAEFYASSTIPDFQGTDALVNFVNTGNPNLGAKTSISSLIFWPMYSTNVEEPPLLTFSDPDVLNITSDIFRTEAMNAVIELTRQFPFAI